MYEPEHIQKMCVKPREKRKKKFVKGIRKK